MKKNEKDDGDNGSAGASGPSKPSDTTSGSSPDYENRSESNLKYVILSFFSAIGQFLADFIEIFNNFF